MKTYIIPGNCVVLTCPENYNPSDQKTFEKEQKSLKNEFHVMVLQEFIYNTAQKSKIWYGNQKNYHPFLVANLDFDEGGKRTYSLELRITEKSSIDEKNYNSNSLLVAEKEITQDYLHRPKFSYKSIDWLARILY